MPRGFKGGKRPADVNGNAVKVMKVAVVEEEYTEDGKNRAAYELGRRGGRARAKKLSSEDRKRIAKLAAEARWGKKHGSD